MILSWSVRFVEHLEINSNRIWIHVNFTAKKKDCDDSCSQLLFAEFLESSGAFCGLWPISDGTVFHNIFILYYSMALIVG